jgi:hypothetical protein
LDLAEEAGREIVERDRSGGGDFARKLVVELGEATRGERPGVIVDRRIVVAVVLVARIPAEQGADVALLTVVPVDGIELRRGWVLPLAAQQRGWPESPESTSAVPRVRKTRSRSPPPKG